MFKDILKNDEDSYETLSTAIKVIDVSKGCVLFNEGEEGDLFYIILRGEVEVFKAQECVIAYEKGSNEETINIDDKITAYYDTFLSQYNDIFWPGMDIVQSAVDEILGIAHTGHDLSRAHPLNEFRQGILLNYIKRREEKQEFINSEGNYYILVRQPLVNLSKGAGFGELALMGVAKRMASV